MGLQFIVGSHFIPYKPNCEILLEVVIGYGNEIELKRVKQMHCSFLCCRSSAGGGGASESHFVWKDALLQCSGVKFMNVIM